MKIVCKIGEKIFPTHLHTCSICACDSFYSLSCLHQRTLHILLYIYVHIYALLHVFSSPKIMLHFGLAFNLALLSHSPPSLSRQVACPLCKCLFVGVVGLTLSNLLSGNNNLGMCVCMCIRLV